VTRLYAVDVELPRRISKPDPVLDRLEREGRLQPATADLRDVLARRGPLTGRSPTPAHTRCKSSAAIVAERDLTECLSGASSRDGSAGDISLGACVCVEKDDLHALSLRVLF
jgi:hypothetical protein